MGAQLLVGCRSARPESDTVGAQRIRASARRALAYLQGQQKAGGQITVSEHSIFDVWETIEAARAISLWVGEKELANSTELRSALLFLSNLETSHGMVLHSSEHGNSCCVEASCEYIRLLWLLESKAVIPKGTAFKKASYLRSMQLTSGTWRIQNPAVPENLLQFPSVTAFALIALDSANTQAQYPTEAVRFLRETQSEEGHWGTDWHYYGTPFYPMDPILEVLRKINTDGSLDTVISKSKNFLLASQRPEGALVRSLGATGNQISHELHTALALKSLLHSGVGDQGPPLVSGLNWLLSRQRKDGSWHGGMFPHPNSRIKKNEDIFCTSQVLILLPIYLDAWMQGEGREGARVPQYDPSCGHALNRTGSF